LSNGERAETILRKKCQFREADSRVFNLSGGRRRHAFITGSMGRLGGDGEHVAFSVPWPAEAGVGHGRNQCMVAGRENENEGVSGSMRP
jgi:hypothetical protein